MTNLDSFSCLYPCLEGMLPWDIPGGSFVVKDSGWGGEWPFLDL